jgi:hypothetical protein
MSTSTTGWQERVRVGFQVFARDGDAAFGAVREVCPDGRRELLVNVENAGDHRLPLEAIADVHDGKVIVDLSRLSLALRFAVAHAHDAEQPGL